ncbi:hypothetical protein HNY73_007486 [Argiope bruennichi]|uniref:Uncharacterized protein n=1 Tax=Argiope bruennichi TaxID=94029 RepID=A0A8T0FGN0_ARGBR|nr:hypothetical protein HNY73_007486 [Argiope bruennichi]
MAVKRLKTTATILIYPKEEKPNANVEDLLKKELQQSETTVKIKSDRRFQKGRLAITCKWEEDLQKLTETLKEAISENITTKRPGIRHPSIIIYNVPNNIPMEYVQRAIRAHTENPDDLKLHFKMRGRTEDISHLILEDLSEWKPVFCPGLMSEKYSSAYLPECKPMFRPGIDVPNTRTFLKNAVQLTRVQTHVPTWD